MMIYNKFFGGNVWPKIKDGSFYDSSKSLNFCNIDLNQLIITKQNAIHGDLPAENIKGEKTAIVFHCTK